MEWTHVATIIGVNIVLIGALATLIVWTVNKLDADVKSIGNRLDGHATRIDQSYHMSNAKHDAAMARIDQLYKMFCDLLQNKK